MNTHPYLRAYMAGVAAPSVALVIALTIFVLTRLVCHIPIPIEQVIIFPMAVVPSAFGLWNIVYMRLKPHRSLPIGLHGAVLPVILVTIGAVSALATGLIVTDSHGITWFGAVSAPYSLLVPWFFGLVVLYYLIWKYVVGFLNQVLGIA